MRPINLFSGISAIPQPRSMTVVGVEPAVALDGVSHIPSIVTREIRFLKSHYNQRSILKQILINSKFLFFNLLHMSISIFMALSTVFHFINSPYNSPFSDSVLPVVSAYWSFQLYISL